MVKFFSSCGGSTLGFAQKVSVIARCWALHCYGRPDLVIIPFEILVVLFLGVVSCVLISFFCFLMGLN